jgi:hypothetical protein
MLMSKCILFNHEYEFDTKTIIYGVQTAKYEVIIV